MVEFINKLTGNKMLVHESRVDEYLAAGHTLAAKPVLEKTEKAEKKPAAKPAAKKTKIK